MWQPGFGVTSTLERIRKFVFRTNEVDDAIQFTTESKFLPYEFNPSIENAFQSCVLSSKTKQNKENRRNCFTISFQPLFWYFVSK